MNEKELEKLSQLAHISLTKGERDALTIGIKKILTYVKQLQEVDTQGVTPCFTVLQHLSNVMREDIQEPPLSTELFLSNVPSSMGKLVRVPPVLNS